DADVVEVRDRSEAATRSTFRWALYLTGIARVTHKRPRHRYRRRRRRDQQRQQAEQRRAHISSRWVHAFYAVCSRGWKRLFWVCIALGSCPSPAGEAEQTETEQRRTRGLWYRVRGEDANIRCANVDVAERLSRDECNVADDHASQQLGRWAALSAD